MFTTSVPTAHNTPTMYATPEAALAALEATPAALEVIVTTTDGVATTEARYPHLEAAAEDIATARLSGCRVDVFAPAAPYTVTVWGVAPFTAHTLTECFADEVAARAMVAEWAGKGHRVALHTPTLRASYPGTPIEYWPAATFG